MSAAQIVGVLALLFIMFATGYLKGYTDGFNR